MFNRSAYPRIKALIISAIVISLAACSSGNETNQSSSAPTSQSTSSDVATAPANSSSSVEEVPKPEEIKFEESTQKVTTGYIDGVNGSTKFKQTISKTQPIVIEGWAVLPDHKKPADMVLITLKDNKSIIISTAVVDRERKDVAGSLNAPSTVTSGWTAEIDPATLSSEKVMLQAWAYDKETKQAYPLNNIPEITRQ